LPTLLPYGKSRIGVPRGSWALYRNRMHPHKLTTKQTVAGPGIVERGHYHNAERVGGGLWRSRRKWEIEKPCKKGVSGAAGEGFEPSLTDPETGITETEL
jgi:hypothetical protein